MIKYVFLDLDDTILDFHMAEAVALKKVLVREGIAATEETISLYSAINDAHWKLLEQGKLTRAEVKLRRFEVFFERMGVKTDAEAARRYYEEQLGVGHYFLPGAEAMLEALFGNYRLFIMSNGTTAVQTGRIESAWIARYFEAIFLSEQMGCVKPQKEFFDACFATIPDFDPDQAIIFGDSLSSDIQGGINAGIKTCWFNPQKKARSAAIVPDYEIDKLEQFAELLKTLSTGGNNYA